MSEGRERSRAMPMRMYRDPAEAYEAAEARTCKGCEHESSVEIAGTLIPMCEKKKKYGKRCKFYKERKGG